MPSSLVFAALVLAWLVILVPMVARRRREVVRTADSALSARVLHRGGHDRYEEVYMSEPDAVPEADPRRYRPGRGGFDPEAAELAARARYSFRQRVVLGLLLTALATGVIAGFALPMLWWAHAAADLLLVGYLAYLRRQVRIEQEIRQRRAQRAARARRQAARATPAPADVAPPPVEREPRQDREPPPPRRVERPVHPGTEVVELDDEDPALCELDPESQGGYRRAVGQ
jgi:hypothetical protein